MRSTLRAIPVLFLLGVMTGCANSGDKTYGEQQKDAARKQWASARAGVLHNLAREQYQTGHFDKCRQTLEDALKLDPDNAAIHLLYAKLGIEQGNLDVSDRELAIARKLVPTDAEADYLSGVVSQRWQRNEQALTYYKAASEKQPAELAYLLAQAETLVAMNKSDEALALLEARVVYFEHSAPIRDAVGQLYMQRGKYIQAVDMFRQASILSTDDLAVREHLALAQFRAKQYRDASDTLVRLLKDERYLKRADLYIAQGECCLQLGRFREARESFELASQISPAQAGIWLGMAKSAMELSDLRRAEMSLKRALTLDPASSESNLLMGYLRLKQDKLDEAMASFRKASALDSTDTVSLCMVGYTLEKQGKNTEAFEYYNRALKLKPGDDLATRLMAEVQLNQ